MRLIDQNDKEIKASDADLTVGYIIEETIIRPDAKSVDNKTKWAYDDDDYEDVQRYIRIPDKVLTAKRLAFLRKQLADTDYCIIKIMEGAATPDEYAETIKKRAEWRAEINALEKEGAT